MGTAVVVRWAPPTWLASDVPAPIRDLKRRAGVLVALALLGAACGGGGSSGSKTLAVGLSDYEITPRAIDAKAGSITFELSNVGTVHHEFAVVRTDLAPEQLPVTADGKLDEKGGGLTYLGGNENVPPGQQVTLTMALTPGAYVFVCNIDDHFKRKMYTRFYITP